MSAFDQHLQDYLTLRRALGHQLADAGRLLPSFVTHLEAAGSTTITVESALAWARRSTFRSSGSQRS